MPTISNIRVGASSATNGGTSPTPGLPSGLAAGDIMICAFYSRASVDESIAISSDWTQLVNDRSSGGLLAVWYRVWQSGDAAPTFTRTNFSGGTSGDTSIAQIMAYSGGNTSSPWDLVGAVSTNASQQNIGAIASAGVMGAEDMVLVIGGKRDDWTSVATLTGDGLTWNELGEPDSTSGADAGLVWNYALNTGSFLSLTSKTFTVTGGAAATGMGVMIAMNVSPNFGTSATTMSNFTSSASGTSVNNVSGSSAVTLAALASTASGAETFTGTSAQTLADFTSDATGSLVSGVTGSAAVTLEDATSTASGLETISGTSAQTLAVFSSTASGAQTFTGSSSSTIDSFSSTASGLETISGTSVQTLAAFTSSASGTLQISATASPNLSDFTSSASGLETISGTSSNTLSNFTSDTSGQVVQNVSGTSEAVIVAFTSNGSALVIISGQSATNNQHFTSNASGASIQNITGELDQNISSFTAQSSGVIQYFLESNSTILNFESSAIGIETISGQLNQTIEQFTAESSGIVNENIYGESSSSIEDFASESSGSVENYITGTASAIMVDFFSNQDTYLISSDGDYYAISGNIMISSKNGKHFKFIKNGRVYISQDGEVIYGIA